MGAFAASAINVAPVAAAVPACKSGALNCYSTSSEGKNMIKAWTWPSGVSREDAITQLAEVVNTYPQEGQKGEVVAYPEESKKGEVVAGEVIKTDTDRGGWKLVDDQFKTSGSAKYEF